MPLVNLRVPRSVHRSKSTPTLVQDLRRVVRGEVRFEAGARAMYAHDASNYRHVPIGAVLPCDADDVVRALEVCRAHDVPVLGRGGGTGLAGQTCNEAVVFDFSKYMRDVVWVDPHRKLARVQPGCVLDELREQTAPVSLTFGPDPATHSRCTIGGMLGNNSCGIHSVLAEFYGSGPRVEDNIESLEIVTYDGLRMTVGPTSPEQYLQIVREGGAKARIYTQMRDLVERYEAAIRNRMPKIPRRVSGYNLEALLPENGFNVARALVGSESTCVTILEATMQLTVALPERALLVLGYPDIIRAAEHIPQIRELRPVGCEGLDEALVEFMRRKHLREAELDLLPEGDAWLLVEFGADTHEEAVATARDAMATIERWPQAPTIRLYDTSETQDKAWEIRESGLGATAFVPGEPNAWPGWEDSAVPPDRVADYLRELRSLLQRYDYKASLYGHFAQGCIHTRIPFELETARGREKFDRFTREAAELVVRMGGTLSGEHGDGQARADLLPTMFGDELVQAFSEFKRIWDPNDRMNPGRIVNAPPRTLDLKQALPREEPRTHFSYPEDEGSFRHATMRCVGIGKCRSMFGGTMCPSYRATREEKHSTRGRARILFEMLSGDPIRDKWHSDDVHEALDLCLSCKGCKSDCPVNVDMATYKAEFLARYHQTHRRPRYAYAFGFIDKWARLGALVPELANLLANTPVISALGKAVAGMSRKRQIPSFATQTFTAWFRRRKHARRQGLRVLLWPDTFNNHFTTAPLVAATRVLEHVGCQVDVPRATLCCGRPLYDYGFLDKAKHYWANVLSALATDIDAGTPLVGVEPSCVAAFRDELVNLFPNDERAKKLARKTFTLAEFLTREDFALPKLERRAIVHGHCHHKAIMGFDADVQLLDKLGLEYEVLDSGCCGMAGSFGFETGKHDISMQIGEHVLLPKVRETTHETLVIADGFSCREQIRQGAQRHALHLAEVVERAFVLERGERAPHEHAMPARRAALGSAAAAMVAGGLLLYALDR